LLEAVDRTTPASVTVIHVLCDNLSIHNGKLARAWLAVHPRFRMHFTPVHCSWMNQVEQWFSILQRKRLRVPNFADLADLEDKLLASSPNGTRSRIRSTGPRSRSKRFSTASTPLGSSASALDRYPQGRRMMVTNL
jgi:hypothetical protein